MEISSLASYKGAQQLNQIMRINTLETLTELNTEYSNIQLIEKWACQRLAKSWRNHIFH